MATTDTRCKVTSCAFHHSQGKCAAGEIQVEMSGGQAFCDTFYPHDVNKQPMTGRGQVRTHIRLSTDASGDVMGDDNLGVNLADATHMDIENSSNLVPVVGCSAVDCTYNEHGICFADEITIDGPRADLSTDTRCATYEPME